MSKIAIYPGTFDPVTYGHLDLIVRSANLFEHVIVAISENLHKKPLFSLAERIDMTQEALKGNDSVQVQGFTGLMADFAKQQNAHIVIRGLRTSNDFDFEAPLANINRHLAPTLETIFLTPMPELSFISSTYVRDIARHGGTLKGLVPPIVAQAIARKFS